MLSKPSSNKETCMKDTKILLYAQLHNEVLQLSDGIHERLIYF